MIERGLSSDYFPNPKVTNEEKHDPLKELPPGIALDIFSYLNRQELSGCHLVSKSWKALAVDKTLLWKFPPKIAVGKEQWEKYIGNVGEEPPLPKDIHKI